MILRDTVRELIDGLQMVTSGGRQFLDKSKDLSEYAVDDPSLPAVNKTITSENVKKMLAEEVKKRTKK